MPDPVGWFAIARKLFAQNGLWDQLTNDQRVILIEIFWRARWKDGFEYVMGKTQPVPRGSFTCQQREFADICRVPYRVMRKTLAYLQTNLTIRCRALPGRCGTLITLINYEYYQSEMVATGLTTRQTSSEPTAHSRAILIEKNKEQGTKKTAVARVNTRPKRPPRKPKQQSLGGTDLPADWERFLGEIRSAMLEVDPQHTCGTAAWARIAPRWRRDLVRAQSEGVNLQRLESALTALRSRPYWQRKITTAGQLIGHVDAMAKDGAGRPAKEAPPHSLAGRNLDFDNW